MMVYSLKSFEENEFQSERPWITDEIGDLKLSFFLKH